MTHSAFTDSSTRNTPEPGGSPRLSKGRQAKRGQNERPLVAGRSGIVPSPRATLGALLCVTSGLLVYSAIRQASSPPTTRYAVAAHDIAPGHVLSPDDVSYTAIDLPHAVQVGALRPDTKLDGVTALGPVAKGELLQSGALVRRPRSARLFSFPIDTAFAVGGRIGPGLRVAVYSTDDDDAVLVAPSALVVRVDNAQEDAMVVTVEIDGETSERSLVAAASHHKLAIVDAGFGLDDARTPGPASQQATASASTGGSA